MTALREEPGSVVRADVVLCLEKCDLTTLDGARHHALSTGHRVEWVKIRRVILSRAGGE